MTNEHRSSEEIEREIERERAGLTNTLDELQNRFSVDTVVRQVSEQFRANGGDIARSVSRSVKENPVALALTGVGLAWMIFGSGSREDRRGSRVDYSDDYRRTARTQARSMRDREDYGTASTDYAGSRHHTGYSDDTGFRRANPRDPYYDGPYASDDLPSWARSTDSHSSDNGQGVGERLSDAAGNVSDKASAAASSVAQKANDLGSSARNTASDFGDDAREKAGNLGSAARANAAAAGAAISDSANAIGSKARDVGSAAADRAAAMRARLAEGTENLSEEARLRVIAAREKAIEARDAAIAQARRSSARASDMFEDQPLVAGALAIAVGAAIGAALPRTRIEDEYLGEQSDNLMQEAERVFAEEKQKLGKVVDAAKDEAQTIADEVKSDAKDAAGEAKSVAGAVADKAKSSAQRVVDTAKSEADKQGVGKPNA
ncbi:hypothetical protein Z945_902 [Sulfitobacter noctilucae]|uniref:DUF3618 domain-containing protein n=1 Tax=Sulfitobacter noctilucae TaxID=1342302 RepID=UPI000468814A|nr:DUF3618 domain-containing protein [Sulfitobacter noctilucae]KIN65855.1 hypothetical protein Z945_902 [Sulfitobacter noctilucae]